MATATATPYQGNFRYLDRGAKPEGSKEAYLLPPLSAFNDVRTLPLTDMKSSLDLGDESPYKLSVHGFTARRHHSALHSAPYTRASWNDEKLLRGIYFPEVEEFVQKVTGCKKVIVSAAVVRNQLYSESDPSSAPPPPAEQNGETPDQGQEPQPFPPIVGNTPTDGICPAPKVHCDLTPRGARYHIRKYHNIVTSAAEKVIEAENKLLESGVQWEDLKDHYQGKKEGEEGIPRFSLFSIWRPLTTVHRDPLALSSCASFPESDYAPSDQLEPVDHSIPAHLSRIIDPDVPSLEVKEVTAHQDKETFKSQGYLAYGPRDKEQTSHAWHFVSQQEPTDVLVIQLFDNQLESYARAPKEGSSEKSDLGVGGVIHSAFELVDQDENAAARQSIEVRCAAFW